MSADRVDPLSAAIATVPAGPWAVGVSGGADSVALLSLLRGRSDLQLHVVHLDHQTRGAESTADAEFVGRLASQWAIPCSSALREEIEPALRDAGVNPSSRFRALRLEFFRQAAAKHQLSGVILAHHADDQAETILSRLLRGSGYAGLAGMSTATMLGGLVVLRPLLAVRRDALRDYLRDQGQGWREDASNRSDQYQRNRLRDVLADQAGLFEGLLRLGDACHAARHWARQAAGPLGEAFPIERLASLPDVLARVSAARWLTERGIPPGELGRSPQSVDRLLAMARDAAGPGRCSFPTGLVVQRRRGIISAAERRGDDPPSAPSQGK